MPFNCILWTSLMIFLKLGRD
uniref:Uncharacterized protein n=1 Tax=Rhizophora mucronata TaxID=61149 RepID=A0A2P2QRV8_RHIMU